MSHPTDDIALEVQKILKKHSKMPGTILACLARIMDSEDNGEFSRLMQKWLASS